MPLSFPLSKVCNGYVSLIISWLMCSVAATVTSFTWKMLRATSCRMSNVSECLWRSQSKSGNHHLKNDQPIRYGKLRQPSAATEINELYSMSRCRLLAKSFCKRSSWIASWILTGTTDAGHAPMIWAPIHSELNGFNQITLYMYATSFLSK